MEFFLIVVVALMGLLMGFLLGYSAARHDLRSNQECLHFWEIVSEPKNDQYGPSYYTYWKEHCAGCGAIRSQRVDGWWTLEQLTGEKTYGVAIPR